MSMRNASRPISINVRKSSICVRFIVPRSSASSVPLGKQPGLDRPRRRDRLLIGSSPGAAPQRPLAGTKRTAELRGGRLRFSARIAAGRAGWIGAGWRPRRLSTSRVSAAAARSGWCVLDARQDGLDIGVQCACILSTSLVTSLPVLSLGSGMSPERHRRSTDLYPTLLSDLCLPLRLLDIHVRQVEDFREAVAASLDLLRDVRGPRVAQLLQHTRRRVCWHVPSKEVQYLSIDRAAVPHRSREAGAELASSSLRMANMAAA